MNSPNKSKKWKDVLLSSGLPLEHLVSKKLSELGIYVSGEYSYLRPNENGIDTEFSVDLWAFNFIEENKGNEDFWASINFAIECKYSHQNTKWLFSPYSNDNDTFSDGYIKTFQDLCVKKIDVRQLHAFDENLPYCIKGVELHEKDSNPYTITKGLNQLKYATVQLSKRFIADQVCSHPDDLEIVFLCSILVTTASLYVFKKGLSLDDFHKANDMLDIADEVDSLVVSQRRSLQLEEYVDRATAKLCSSHTEIEKRLEEIDRVLAGSDFEGYQVSNSFFLKDVMGSASERILVVNFSSLDKVINNILDLVRNSGKTLKKYAALEYDQKSKRIIVKPL